MAPPSMPSAYRFRISLCSAAFERQGQVGLPSLVVAALAMRNQALVRLKPFCTLYAVELSQAGEILWSFGACVFCQMFWGAQVSVDLV